MNLNPFNVSRIKESRLPWIDYARGIAIFLVLYRHIFEGIKRSGIDISHYAYLEHGNIIFFSFRMPLFFIISGIFIGGSLSKRGVWGFIRNKWKLLLYPYLLWSFIQITLQIYLSKYVNAHRSFHDYLYILYAPREIDQFWYLYALFNTSVLYAVTRVLWKIRGFYQLGIGLFMFFISSFSFLVEHKIHLGFIYDILHFYFFIALGDMISSFMLNPKNTPLLSSWKMFLVILPFFWVCQWYFLKTNLANSRYSYVEDYQPYLFIIIALSGCVFMTNISFILQRYRVLRWLQMIGYHSLYIYLMHVLASSAIRIILTREFGIVNVPLLLLLGIFAGLLLPVLFYQLAMKAGAWWLFSLEKPADKKRAISKKEPVAG